MKTMGNNAGWLTLDNAAKIYPATSTESSPAVFRLIAILSNPIKYSELQIALKKVILRCPYFQVFLKKGFFWYYLQRHNSIPEIQLLEPIPNLSLLNKKKISHLLQIGIRENTIAIDFSHIITDGSGAIRFLMTLIYEYLDQCGIRIERNNEILDTAVEPAIDEYEDAHRKFFQDGIPKPENLSPAFHLPGKPLYHQKYSVLSGKIKITEILDLARKNNVTLTEYLSALYMFCLIQIYENEAGKGRKPGRSVIRLEVPVNMRQFFKSQTMRNFSLYVSPEIDLKLGNYNFRELLKRVHHSIQMQIDSKELGRQISRNVGAELNPIIRIFPLFLKDVYLSWIYSRLCENVYSGVLTNLGKVNIPEEMKPFIESFRVLLYPNRVMKKSCTIISYQNDLHITFCSFIENRELERLFFTKLVEAGISVSVMEE
ncbi:MAG: hypothetical protein H8E57_03520 [Candidatus Cloacimonetes bacterium]|nr:hypothetical protein [Candidatus Cloacimonadota bacterium]